jgi:hypothetical protein
MSIDLKDWQIDIGGILLGHGTRIPVAAIEGLARPGTRGDVVERPGTDGAWLAPDWYEARTVRIDCAIKTPGDPEAAAGLLAALEQVAENSRVRTVGGAVMPLRIKWPGSPVRVLFGRIRKLEATWEKAAFGWIPLDIEFTAPDPVYGDDVEQQVELRLGWLSGGGFTAPVQAPIIVNGAGATGGQKRPGWVINGGNVDTFPVLTVHGPCANPQITHVETGRTITVPVVLDAGQWVRIDTRPGQRVITRNNGGAVATTQPLDAFRLPAGRSEIRWTAADPTLSARLTVAWRDAFTTLGTPLETSFS